MSIPIVTIIGKSKSGKTTLLEKLIPALRQKGYRVGTVKHHSHPGFEIDQPGKDSWRYAKAGSQQVVIAAPDKIASYRLTEIEHPWMKYWANSEMWISSWWKAINGRENRLSKSSGLSGVQSLSDLLGNGLP